MPYIKNNYVNGILAINNWSDSIETNANLDWAKTIETSKNLDWRNTIETADALKWNQTIELAKSLDWKNSIEQASDLGFTGTKYEWVDDYNKPDSKEPYKSNLIDPNDTSKASSIRDVFVYGAGKGNWFDIYRSMPVRKRFSLYWCYNYKCIK